MPKYITDPANENYDFGTGFNYAVWTEGSVVTLTNVPWNNDYRDVCQFPDASGRTLDEYIDSNVSTNSTINNISYIKFNVPVIINVPFNKAFMYNYLRVQNPLQPIEGDVVKSYYYFILDAKYLAPNATELTIQLDVFQSFRNDFTFGNSYIERGHIGIANENAFNNYGRDYLTVPEGLDIGGEYLQIARRKDEIVDIYSVNSFSILVVSTVRLDVDPGSVSDPKLTSAVGDITQGIPSGAEVYVFPDYESFSLLMQGYSNYPWITQGIISITLIPDVTRYGYSLRETGIVNGITFYKLDDGALDGKGKYTDIFPNWRDSPEIFNNIAVRYRHLLKLFTYPYMVIEMTTWGATPIILKPESWADSNARISEKISLLPPGQRIVVYPNRYNAKSDSIIDQQDINGDIQYYDDGGDYLDFATQISNFPSIAIVNNMAINYLAANKNSIAFQNASADWSQQRALRGNEVSYDQANKAIQTSENINKLQNAGVGAQAANQNLLLANNQAVTGIGGVIASSGQAALGITNGTLGLGGIAGSVANQVIGAITTGNQQDANIQSANITQQVSRGVNAGQNKQTGYVNDTNKALADWAARGDYENAIAGINAKVQDAKLTQPSSSGQMGGEAFNIINRASEVSLRWKIIDNAAIRSVGEYWLRYGYAVRQFSSIPSNFMVMTKFTYWKLLETYINSASMPEGFKQIIRGIFEKGVTVWADPTYIGNTDLADNQPLEGITL